jgi:drug/metabolite transporter (DMT)-like permease
VNQTSVASSTSAAIGFAVPPIKVIGYGPAVPVSAGPSSRSRARIVNLLPLATLLFLGAVWGASFLFVRVAGSEVGPVWAAEIRIAIGALVLLIIFGRRTWAVARPRLGTFLIAGAAFSAIPFSLIAISVQTLPVGLGAILNASTPLFTALLGIVWLGERMSVRLLLGLLTGFAAVAVLVGWSPLDADLATLVAVAAALGAALSYAFAGTFVRRRLPGVGGAEIATAQLAAGAVLLLPFAIATGAPGTPTPTGLLALLAVGTLSTALPWPIFFRLLRSTTATVASSVTFVVPAFAVTWGALALGETIGPELILGFAMIIVSLLLVLGLGPSLGLGRLSRIASRRAVSPVA